jgi:hypothetical protein
MVAWKVAERNSLALSLITRSSRQPRLARSAATWRARALVQVAEGLCLGDLEGGPGVGRGDVDGGVLLDRALSATEAADSEAIELDELARMMHVQMALGRRGRPFKSWWGRVDGDQPVALGPSREAVAAQHPPDPVG